MLAEKIFEEKEAETDEFEFVALGDAELESEFITEDIAELPLEEESEDAVVSNIKKEVLPILLVVLLIFGKGLLGDKQ